MKMIEPGGIPQFIGDFEQLDKDVSALRSDAIGIRNGGADVHSRFQMLGAYYTAPEADDLFASTRPVMDRADTFAADLETVADALDTFSSEARPLAKRLETLEADARKFVASVEGDDDWHYDDEKTDRNNELVDDVAVTRNAFEAAERRAATKISAIVGGPKFIEDDGSHKATKKTVMYGYDAELLKQAKETPWGSHVSESIHAWEIHRHIKHYVWDGFIVGGGGAALEGLGHLVGIGGSAKEAWSGLADVLGGIGQYTLTPYDWVMDHTIGPDEESAGEKRQKTAAREFAKSMVAWDQWEEHPVQAAGTTTFNILTLGAGPLGMAAKGGKAGAASKAAGVAAKIGTYADPLSASLTVGGKAFSKLPSIADLTARVRTGTDAAPELRRVHTDLEFDGSRVRVEDGKFIRVDAEGKPIKDTAPNEKAAAERALPEEAPSQREPGLVGAGARTPQASAHTGEHLPPQASHEPPAGRGDADSPRSNGHTDVGGSAGPLSNDGPSPSGPTGVGGNRGAGDVPGPRTSGGSGSDGLPGRGVDESLPTGKNWYDHLDPHQIKDVQVYRANHEPGYRKLYYQKNGQRLRVATPDESGFAPPQLIEDPNRPGAWIAASDKSPAIPEKYVPGSKVERGAGTVRTPEDLDTISGKAERRHASVTADNVWHDPVKDAKAAYKANPTPENLQAYKDIKADHAPFHRAMSEDSEAFGEAVARHHVIPEHYRGAQMEELAGPKNGNDQFDQLWSLTDESGKKKFIVIESKSTTTTQLGKRELPSGFDARQGSREYFLDIMREMRQRSLDNSYPKEQRLNEKRLYKALSKALKEGNVEYILVKGKVTSTGEYAGYQKWNFDIS
ncbi:MAG: hypothetical protein WCD21_37525 [Streptomyces sp.]